MDTLDGMESVTRDIAINAAGSGIWLLAKPGRGDSCHRCNADLRVCLNCISYDPRAAHQCRDRRADPVLEKAAGNFCEYFELARRTFLPKTEINPREKTARDQLEETVSATRAL